MTRWRRPNLLALRGANAARTLQRSKPVRKTLGERSTFMMHPHGDMAGPSAGEIYCGAATSLGKADAEALLEIVGAPMPAVVEPKPSCRRVNASSFPVGFSPCAAWNLRIPSLVASSHLPEGSPLSAPFFAKAC
jgi:hypothetical protein